MLLPELQEWRAPAVTNGDVVTLPSGLTVSVEFLAQKTGEPPKADFNILATGESADGVPEHMLCVSDVGEVARPWLMRALRRAVEYHWDDTFTLDNDARPPDFDILPLAERTRTPQELLQLMSHILVTAAHWWTAFPSGTCAA